MSTSLGIPPSPEDLYSLSDVAVLRTTDSSPISSLNSRGFTKEKMRVGSPPLLMLPLRDMQFTSNASPLQLFTAISSHIEDKLRQRSIEYSSYCFVNRVPPGHTVGIPTVIVRARARGNYMDNWLSTVDDLCQLCSEFGLTSQRFLVPIAVELIDPRLEELWWAKPLEPTHLLARNWSNLKREAVAATINEKLPSSVIKDIQAVNLFRYGPYDKPHKQRPTIIVSIKPGHSYCIWRETEDAINDALSSYNIVIKNKQGRCLFVPSIVQPFVTIEPIYIPTIQEAEQDSLDVDHYFSGNGPLHMGDSLGPNQFERDRAGAEIKGSIGTLGGLIRLRNMTDNGKDLGLYALTNYHVLRPGIPGFAVGKDGSEIVPKNRTKLYDLDHQGIERGKDPKASFGAKVMLESPARRNGRCTLQDLELQRADATAGALAATGTPQGNQSHQLQLADIDRRTRKVQEFYAHDKQKVGSVVMASGFSRRTKGNSRLDWAILRVATQRLPAIANKLNPMRPLMPAGILNALRFSQVMQQGVKTIGDPLFYMNRPPVTTYKLGAVIGFSRGVFETVKADVSLGPWNLNKGTSEEVAFLGQANDHLQYPVQFATRGDSGAWIFDREGNWLGMIFAGHTMIDITRPNVQSLAYMTPAKVIIDDIQAKFKEEGLDIRVELPQELFWVVWVRLLVPFHGLLYHAILRYLHLARPHHI